ncbi:MAG: hypothetical protein IAI50_10165 [Candidatus Eremiobacteraeota bacterium]|nr:hypothetical protein [Candidatus Eremiobacteraeota bacterium]
MKTRIGAWTIATALVATMLYVLALRADVYGATSPYWLSWHVALRKAYSIVAFCAVAYLYRRALAEHGGTRFIARCIVATASYSAAIEVGQFITGSREGLGWNAFDTLCGAVGGGLATIDLWSVKRRAGHS